MWSTPLSRAVYKRGHGRQPLQEHSLVEIVITVVIHLALAATHLQTAGRLLAGKKDGSCVRQLADVILIVVVADADVIIVIVVVVVVVVVAVAAAAGGHGRITNRPWGGARWTTTLPELAKLS